MSTQEQETIQDLETAMALESDPDIIAAITQAIEMIKAQGLGVVEKTPIGGYGKAQAWQEVVAAEVEE